MTHDDGLIVSNHNLENHSCIPNVVCIFIYNGMVKVDGKNVIEINKVRRDYDRYGGGFKFEYYKNCCDNKSLQNCCDNKSLQNWINNN